MSSRVDYVAFGVIIDDIVHPDGTTQVGVLGGGGPQTAFGMRIWSDAVGLAAGIGMDFSAMVRSWLDESHIDGSGLRINDSPTARAWQLFEYDERRTQIWRVPREVFSSQLRRAIDLLPQAYRDAKGFHFGIHPEEPDTEFVSAINQLGAVVSIEPFRPAQKAPTGRELHDLLSGVDIFSTNLLEAVSLVGSGPPEVISDRLVEAGARIVVLRLGAEGAMITDRELMKKIRVPAVPVQVVNPIGAGNAFCGGFLAGWVESHDLVTGGVYGAVSASYLVESNKIPTVNQTVIKQAHQRAKELIPQVAWI